jgi:alpha-tubulin suppressor-like RCC1 family protein
VSGPNFYIHTSDGRVYSWGGNGVSQGNNGTASNRPRTIKQCSGGDLSDIVKIDGANESTLSCIGFLNSDNSLFNL